MTIDVVVVGGGISGLAAAFELMRYDRRVIVLERQQAVGGNTVSERLNDLLMEHDPSTISAQSETPCGISSMLGLGDERCELAGDLHRCTPSQAALSMQINESDRKDAVGLARIVDR